eukprot:superscaffoldBa00000285_g3499
MAYLNGPFVFLAHYTINGQGLNTLPFDPATNNDPLQFNGSSGPLVTECPPLENAVENSKKRKRASLPPGTDNNSLTSIASLLREYAMV